MGILARRIEVEKKTHRPVMRASSTGSTMSLVGVRAFLVLAVPVSADLVALVALTDVLDVVAGAVWDFVVDLLCRFGNSLALDGTGAGACVGRRGITRSSLGNEGNEETKLGICEKQQ